MIAVILAGGLGKRLMPFTTVLPKPLLPLGERSLLEHQILALRDAGCTSVYVATHYKSDMIATVLGDGAQLGIKVKISREQKPLGTAGPVKLLEADLTQPFVVMNGDILTKLDFRRFYEFGCSQDADLTIATKIITTPFRFGNVKVDDNNNVVDVVEKPDFNIEILAGIYFMKPGVFDVIPADTYYGMDQLILRFLERRKRVVRYLIQEYWLDIGQVDDYTKAREFYANEFGQPTLE